MNVLITYQLGKEDENAMETLAFRLVSLLTQNHFDVGVLTDKNTFGNARIFPVQEPPKDSFFKQFQTKKNGCYEEFLSAQNHFDKTYMETYTNAAVHAIEAMQANVVIDLQQPLGLVAARIKQVPVFSYMHMAMFRHKQFAIECLKPFNAYLKSLGFEQILYLTDLFQFSTKLFTFGTNSFQPFDDSLPDFYRFHSFCDTQLAFGKQDETLFYVKDDKKFYKQTKKVILEAFQGSQQAVTVYSKQAKKERIDNILFTNDFEDFDLRRARIVFHDGNEALMQRCLYEGIVQIVYNDRSYLKNYNCNALNRNKVAISFLAKSFNVANVYESYRKVLVDPTYQQNAFQLQAAIKQGYHFDQFLHLFAIL